MSRDPFRSPEVCAWVRSGAFLVALLVPSLAAAQVKEVPKDRFEVEIDGVRLQIPLAQTHSLLRGSSSVTRGVVVLHGKSRNAAGYHRYMVRGAKAAKADGTSAIFAPLWVTEKDLARHRLGSEIPFWSPTRWSRGHRSKTTPKNPRKAQVSSFEVVDRILGKLCDKKLFPNLRQLVVAGHSGGGQFVNRYAAGSMFDPPRGVEILYVMANPGAYLYLTPERRVGDSLSEFAPPPPHVLAKCPKYDHYKFGLQKLNRYMGRSTPGELRARFARRRVLYMLGTKDNDPNHRDLDRKCAAMLQGANRVERGQIYLNYLKKVFGSKIGKKHQILMLPGVSHNAREVFTSPVATNAIFSSR
ncbi:MAG: alpha/beta hydrolase [Planctomycetes bacterium]|nr:alpha/beta hydrolase [Planctomycetota bacterium]